MKARIIEYNSGKYARNGEYIANIRPEYFKNGEIKKTVFVIEDFIETIKKGYRYGGAKRTYRIYSIFDENGKERYLK